jgi:TonB family protein
MRVVSDRQSGNRLGAAFAASLSMHALLLTVLGLGAGVPKPSFAPQPELWVELVGPGGSAQAAREGPDRSPPAFRAVVAPPPRPPAPNAAQTTALESRPSEPERPPSRTSNGSADRPPHLADGQVDVATTTTLARLGEALAGRSMSEFAPELEQPVRLASKLEPTYPVAALQARHEGSVLAWVHVDRDGTVKEVQIVEGEPEFADSVRDCILKAHFLPAEVDGQPVEHYIILQFDFRIGLDLPPPRTEDLGERPVR